MKTALEVIQELEYVEPPDYYEVILWQNNDEVSIHLDNILEVDKLKHTVKTALNRFDTEVAVIAVWNAIPERREELNV